MIELYIVKFSLYIIVIIHQVFFKIILAVIDLKFALYCVSAG